MCNCKELKHKLTVAEDLIDSFGEPYRILYRVKSATASDHSGYYIGGLIAIIMVASLYFFHSQSTKSTQQEQQVQPLTQTEIEY